MHANQLRNTDLSIKTEKISTRTLHSCLLEGCGSSAQWTAAWRGAPPGRVGGRRLAHGELEEGCDRWCSAARGHPACSRGSRRGKVEDIGRHRARFDPRVTVDRLGTDQVRPVILVCN
jgi:hypothetical protein